MIPRDFMGEIATRTRLRVAGAKERLPLSALRDTVMAAGPPPRSFERALAGPDFAFIC